MRSIWFVARYDVSHLLRQRETILWTFVMPIVFFYFIGTITGGSMGVRGSADRPDPIALRAPADGGFLVDELVRRLDQQNYRVSRPRTDDAFNRFSRRLTVPAPASGRTFTEAVLAGEAQEIAFANRGEGPTASFDQVRVTRAVYGVLADLAIARGRSETPDAATFERLAAEPRQVTVRVVSAGRRLDPPGGFEQTIPGTMVMFTMLVLLTSGAILLVIERGEGLLRRLASTPIPRSALVAGKWAGRLALGLVQIGFAMAAGTVFFGMRWGASTPMVLAVLFAWAAFNASLGILLGNLARSRGQMAGIGVLVTMVLAALGGCWWPIEVTPAWMQSFALVLPTGWAMDAMHKLISFGYGASAAVPHAAGLAVAALVAGVAGVRTFRYQ
jgi:ABC-type Na+ efflux pump permease subunit